MTPDTAGQGGTPGAAGRDTSRAIEVKKAQAAANRDKIAAAILALQRDDRPDNVQSVARAAGVHPHTIRRNPALLAEVTHLRESSWHRPPTTHADPTAAASYKALKAKLLAAQAEVSDLRRDLTQLRRDAHQALGTAPTRVEPTTVQNFEQEIAELRVQLMNERDTTRSLQDATHDHADELTAAHEIARGYLRELNQTKDELQRARQELVKLRTKTTTASPPHPGSTAEPDTANTPRLTTRERVADLTDALGPGWQLTQGSDSDQAEQRWHLEHDQTRVGVIRRTVTTRGRTAWSAHTLDGHEVEALDRFAASSGSRLWRTRDLAAAGLARHGSHR